MNTHLPWFETVQQLEATGQAYVLITVVGTLGSTPRNSGTKMVVTIDNGNQSDNVNHNLNRLNSESISLGTIGGGHLEHKAIKIALALLTKSIKHQQTMQHIEHFPLGAKLGQCCGGQTSLLFESFIGAALNIMLFGAGHVGKSLASILAQLPCKLNWVDNRAEQFPNDKEILALGSNVKKIITETPEDEVKLMPINSYYIVMTHNHAFDFNITEAILARADAQYIGLIGSNTKWQRFKMRFDHRDIKQNVYQQVCCPIGLSQVPGKLPIEVAVSIAAEVINNYHQHKKTMNHHSQGIHWRELSPLAQQLAVKNDVVTTNT